VPLIDPTHIQNFKLITVQLTAFIFGIAVGFTGPNIQLFISDETPLKDGKITPEQISWITSLSPFGAIAFVFVYGWISERFGRKAAVLFIGIPQTVCDDNFTIHCQHLTYFTYFS
jgi:MFS family permease